MEIKWEDESEISVRVEKDGIVVLSGNKARLLTMSRMLANLAKCEAGEHMHLDEENEFEDGSGKLKVDKVV